MAQLIKCDKCGDTVDRQDTQMYNISKHTDEFMEGGDFCEECLPDSIIDSMDREEF